MVVSYIAVLLCSTSILKYYCNPGPNAIGPNNEPSEDNFETVPCEMPPHNVLEGHLLIQNMIISVDPAQRCQMNEATGADFLSPWQIRETVIGLCGIGKVITSRHSDWTEGDLIQGVMEWPWKKYFIVNIQEKDNLYHKLDPGLRERPSLASSILVGLTSIIGIHEVGQVKAGQTLVVSAAAGACGSLAGQLGKQSGCDVVGVCGSSEKCNWITSELGFNHAINYKEEDVSERLSQCCPHGIDVYFDNVGGKVSDAVIQQMKPNSIVILCGQISQYNKDVPYPPPLSAHIQKVIEDKNIKRDRYLVLHHKEKFEKYTKELIRLSTSTLIFRESVVEGLENTGKAFTDMMKGANFGKQIVKV